MMANLSTTSLTSIEFDLDYEAEYNETECLVYDEPPVTIYSVILLICLFGLVGNGIVLWFLGFHIKRNPFTVYILNLAITDACFLLSSVTCIITHMVKGSFCVDETFIFIFLLCNFLAVLTYNNSLYLLTAISIERCLSVLYPIWHRCRRPRHLSAIVCALLWALSILLAGSVAFFCVILGNEICVISLLPIFVLNILIFTPIMILSNLTLFIKVRRSSQRQQPGKLYIVILLSVFFFLLFAVPMSVETFLVYHNIHDSSEIFQMLCSANSSINPFIYFLVGSYRKRRFRGFIKDALQSVFKEKVDPREDGETTRVDPVETSS
ncbi:mas-related G-protein coupled receptor member H-like [Emydura macquarii macquarii]|uniref:mas-related G-protein coupled receptor member H-like n=1 Tax=Emydura macquarii macquarii TaxID=1129001 RepID=UPI00352A8448